MWESPRLSFFVIEVFGTNAQPASHDAERWGIGHSPTSILNLDLKNPIQKSRVGTSSPCLPRLLQSKNSSTSLNLLAFVLSPLWDLIFTFYSDAAKKGIKVKFAIIPFCAKPIFIPWDKTLQIHYGVNPSF